jgi:hypothetical protein
VHINNKEGIISIVGNAISNQQMNVILKNVPDGNYAVNLVNNAGQILYNGKVAHIAGDVKTINLNTPLSGGIYHIQVLIEGKMYHAPVLVK